MAISKVGLGWDVGERDYASLNLWSSGKSGSGVAEQAHCKGSCTTATLNITSGFTAGALIYGDVEYDGSNESALAFANNRINITVANVVVEDLSIAQSSNFLNTAVANGSGVVYRRCRIRHLGAHGTSYAALQALNGGTAENCVASTAGARITNHSFNNPLTFSNCLFFGSTGIGVGPIYSTFQTVINCFSFNNAGDDYFGANPSDETFDCASEDLTGNETGYTSAECVDFDNNDFRIKSTSDLHALNIGAFFESAGGDSVNSDISAGVPFFGVSVNQSADAPEYQSDISAGVPLFSAAVSQSSEIPNYSSAVSIGVPLFSIVASQQQIAEGSSAIAFNVPLFGVSANQASTVPEFISAVQFGVQMFSVSAQQESDVPTDGATVSFSVPLFGVSVNQESTVPQYDSAISFGVPFFGVSILSGEFDYYASPDAVVDIPNLSRLVDIPSLSRRIDI
ncbi:hypothetical protein ORI99_00290 [Alishewanella sp. SMS9]|nr:hypothetical protein [Alishewanella sp. SMS9]